MSLQRFIHQKIFPSDDRKDNMGRVQDLLVKLKQQGKQFNEARASGNNRVVISYKPLQSTLQELKVVQQWSPLVGALLNAAITLVQQADSVGHAIDQNTINSIISTVTDALTTASIQHEPTAITPTATITAKSIEVKTPVESSDVDSNQVAIQELRQQLKKQQNTIIALKLIIKKKFKHEYDLYFNDKPEA